MPLHPDYPILLSSTGHYTFLLSKRKKRDVEEQHKEMREKASAWDTLIIDFPEHFILQIQT